MRAGAGARRGEGVAPGFALASAISSGMVLAGRSMPHHQQVGHRPQHRDRVKSLSASNGELGVERRRNRMRGDGVEADRVAVGRALAIASVPILPPEPELFSTMNCWPVSSASSAQTMRDSVSVGPPGGKHHDVAHRPVRPVVDRAGDAGARSSARQAGRTHGDAEKLLGPFERKPPVLFHWLCSLTARAPNSKAVYAPRWRKQNGIWNVPRVPAPARRERAVGLGRNFASPRSTRPSAWGSTRCGSPSCISTPSARCSPRR